MITKITYRCQTCCKERTAELSEDSPNVIPQYWIRDEFVDAGYSLDFCSPLCRDKFRRIHPTLGFSPPPRNQSPRIIPVQIDPSNYIRAIFESAQQAKNEAIVQLAEEFGVPAETVSEFGFYLQTLSCPKCGAQSGEACKVLAGDETTVCPYHDQEELKAVVHKERLDAAKKSWKSRLQ
jgi:hypothetical protein